MRDALPPGWRFMRLDQLGTVERGRSRHRPRNDPALYGGRYPFVQTGDIKAAGLRLFDYTQTYSELGLSQSRLWPPGTLCITIAANICDTAILGIPACFPDSIVGFTAAQTIADTVFVKYSLDHAKRRFADISRGATQDNLSLEKLLSQRLPVPPLDQQRRIASILGAYDELIEVNRRRIAVLEEMARRLFEEWFVLVASVAAADGEDALPAGWSRRELRELIQLDKGVSYSGDGLTPDGEPLVNLKNILAGGGFRTDGLKRYSGEVKPRHCVVPGDLVIANTDLTPSGGVIGNAALVPVIDGAARIALTHHLFAVRPLKGSAVGRHYMCHWLNSPRFKSYARGHANGATVLGLRADSA